MNNELRASKWVSQRVLIVEDNADSADLLRLILESIDCEVTVASNALEALAMVETSIPHTAVIDIGLPGIDGNDLARRLRASSRTSQCRLVALTGYGGPKALAMTRAAGFDAHLVKPVEMDEILRCVASRDVNTSLEDLSRLGCDRRAHRLAHQRHHL